MGCAVVSIVLASTDHIAFFASWLETLAIIESNGYIIPEWEDQHVPPHTHSDLQKLVAPLPLSTLPYRVLHALYNAIEDREQAGHLQYFMVNLLFPLSDLIPPSHRDWERRVDGIVVDPKAILDWGVSRAGTHATTVHLERSVSPLLIKWIVSLMSIGGSTNDT